MQTRSSLAILITMAVLVEVMGGVQYWFAARGIREEAKYRAESEIHISSQHIKNVLTSVEVAVNNMVWAVEQNLEQSDAVYVPIQHIVKNNDEIVGCGIGFVPDYYPQKGRWYEPYVVQHPDGSTEEMQIGSEQHDYLKADWYIHGLNTTKGMWTEPYYDEAGAKQMLCTYVKPIHDGDGRVVGVIGADVSLAWLGELINDAPLYPSSYNLIISRTGEIMACPVESLVMHSNIRDVTARMEDTTVNRVYSQMMEGKGGQTTLTDIRGEKCHVFYAPVGGDTGWSMAVVCSHNEMYRRLHTVSFNLVLLLLSGMGLMAYIVFRSIRGFNHLQLVNAEKERMSSELSIANSIQMGMLPKTFPPFPDRDDVEVFGSLVPAKEVGGDLYDFFIRDEKLFFCVGDVSGKGIPASLLMAVTRSIFRTVSAREANPGRIMESMNTAMSEINDSNMFVTIFVGVLDLPTGRLHYCNGGHCAPLLVDGGVGLLPVDSNIPIGVIDDWKFTVQESIVSSQTTIFLYTDGLTEAENSAHELFGEMRMMKVAQQGNYKNPTDLIGGMQDAVQQFVLDAEQSDDLTMLAVRYMKEQHEERLSRSITLSNDMESVSHLSAFVEEVAEAVGFDAPMVMNLNLAVEEAVVNVINYAYPEGTKGNINIEACANDVRLKFTITDTGIPFDPTAIKDADTSLSAEERPIGGLGIYLVRQLMDSINYEYADGHNVLTLRKKLA